MKTSDFRELKVWQISMDFAVSAYNVVKSLPNVEKYALGDQIRRSAISIPSNIAEGHGRNSPKEFGHFISIARGSLSELQTQLYLCERLKYIDKETIDQLTFTARGIDKMLCNLKESLHV